MRQHAIKYLSNPKDRSRGEKLLKGLCVDCGLEPHEPDNVRGSNCRKKNIEAAERFKARQKGVFLPSVLHKRKPTIKEDGTFNPLAPKPKRITKAVKQKDRTGEAAWKRNMKIYWEGIGSAFSGAMLPLQYAHIKRHEGPDDHFVANGFPLTPTEHFLYDHGYIRVTADYIIEVCGEAMADYGYLHGLRVRLPEDNTHWPSAVTLALHDEQSKWRGNNA